MDIGQPVRVHEVEEDSVPYEGEEVSPGEDLDTEVEVEIDEGAEVPA